MSNDVKVVLTVLLLVCFAKLCGCTAAVDSAPIDDLDVAAGDGELGKPDLEISNVRSKPVDDLEQSDQVDAGDGELGDAEVLPDAQDDAGDELGDAEVLPDAQGDAGDELGDAEVLPDAQGDAGDGDECDIAGDWHLNATFSVLCFNSNTGFEVTISDQESTCPTVLGRELKLDDSNLGLYEGSITYELNLNESGQLVGTASASGTLTNSTFGTMQCDTDGTVIGIRN
jgi:hypothetical protein